MSAILQETLKKYPTEKAYIRERWLGLTRSWQTELKFMERLVQEGGSTHTLTSPLLCLNKMQILVREARMWPELAKLERVELLLRTVDVAGATTAIKVLIQTIECSPACQSGITCVVSPCLCGTAVLHV